MSPHSPVLVIGQRLLLTIWIGALWTVGFLVVPVLFQELEPHVAGTVAGRLFSLVAFVGLGCGALLWLAEFYRNRFQCNFTLLLLTLMLLLTLVNEFTLAPEISSLRENGAVESTVFRQLHAAASLTYLANCLTGLLLVVRKFNCADQV